MRQTYEFFAGDAGLSLAFSQFERQDTGAAVTPVLIYAAPTAGGWYRFDVDWDAVGGASSIKYTVTLPNGSTVADIITGYSVPGVSPTAGMASLSSLRSKVRQRTDTENDPHISDPELTDWLNGSYSELYDLLVTRFGEDYYTAQASIATDGSSDLFPLPNGVLYGAAPAFYKGALVELSVPSPQKWATLHRFNLGEKNRFALPQYVSTAGPVNLRYRLTGSNLHLAPLPTAGRTIRLWYAPRPATLAQDSDVADGVSGWLDYVVADACVKVCGKQERDPSLFLAQKAGLKERIELAAQNRDPGEPATVTITESDDFLAGPFGFGFGGGY